MNCESCIVCSDKEQLVEEEDDELKEVLDLRKIAVQLLQQEQQNRRRSLICRAESLIHRRRVTGRAHRFLSHSGSSGNKPRPPPQHRSASLDEGSSGASVLSGQPSSSCSFDGSLKTDSSDSDPKWPDVPPVLNQNEERRRNKYLRKDYLKYKCQTARKNSNGNDECEEGLSNADFSTTLTVFGLKPRSAFAKGSRQEYASTDPSFTMRRKMEHLREEIEQIGILRQKSNKKAKVPLNESSGLSGVSDTQAAEENAMESGASQVNHSEQSVLIRSRIREEIGTAFEKFQPQLDALKGELDSCCQNLSDME
ncbi:leucine-rich repeat and calponin homology domain-containing protein 2-like [Notothenia coriiceps]|uniref:Leucine-rich repeat and calponin homology domain-containing protein 2-like n=1 Tax=Notothenia coriiceps TaxID=8208 RepID=A0A6I9PLN4_9TELE|nr:PREDICTED: leucine-rich repeat and calponin homology domain-containing protein 2-like [Notothenia coriiceps]